MRRSEQRQNVKGKRLAAPEDDLRTSELSRPLQEASDLVLSVLEKDAAGEHDPHSHRWSELQYKVRSFLPPLSVVLICRARADGRSPCSFQHCHSNGQRRRNRSKQTFRPSLAHFRCADPTPNKTKTAAHCCPAFTPTIDIPLARAPGSIRITRPVSGAGTRQLYTSACAGLDGG